MPQVRVVVSITAASAEAADEAIRQRVEVCKRVEAEEEGCLQYEIYRSVMRPECYTLMELWTSKAIYDKHWRLSQARGSGKPPSPPPLGAAHQTVEMYKQTLFQRVDGIWQASDPEERMETIRWT